MTKTPTAYLEKSGWYSCYCEDGTFLGLKATAAEALEVYGCTVYKPLRPETETAIRSLMQILKACIGRQIEKGITEPDAVALVTREFSGTFPDGAKILLRLLESGHPSVTFDN